MWVAPVVGPALAIVLGEVAGRQIARTGEAGSRLARAGRILGGTCPDGAHHRSRPAAWRSAESTVIAP
jgi:hypothetical protein